MLRATSQPRRWALIAIATLTMAGAACGKKGPPLAPIVHIPAAVEHIEARRRGNDVSLTVTVPAKNIDGTIPVDVSRIEVFAFTGTAAPPLSRFVELGTRIGTIMVPPLQADAPPEAAPPPGTPVPGGPATVVESLTPDALVATPIPPAPAAKRALPPLPNAPAATVETGPLRRFYYAVAFSPRGRPGPPGTIAELRLTTLPDPPMDVKATYIADSVQLEWEASGGLLGFLLERALPPEPSPLDNPVPEATTGPPSVAPLQGPTRYNVYREIAPLEPTASPSEPASPERQGGGGTKPTTPEVATKPLGEGAAINTAPLDTLTFVDPLSGLDGRQRCYVVRSVRGDGAQVVEGVSSYPVCVEPVDDFPPDPPTRLSTVSSEGAITLIWEPNAEPDIAGYLVLRGEAGDATLTPVSDTVVTEARFTDRTVKPGVRYVYAVQAIDSRLPRPNVSGESARVEETAR
jgi:predicted small lipoprotein YifL